ncbi:MAG: hypothetical protein V2A76_01090 [Planctomycetota bacterium]
MVKKNVKRAPALKKQSPARKKKVVAGKASPGEVPEAPGEAPPLPPEVGPFDADFFRSQFPNLLPPAEGKPVPPRPHPYSVTLVLGDGMAQLDLYQIEELSEQWALVSVQEGNGFADVGGPARYVFVPYAAIARVEVSGSESRLAPIGFHRMPAEKKVAGKKSSGPRKKKAAPAKRGRRKATARRGEKPAQE